MKNKDFIALKRAEILNKMNEAIASNNSEAFSDAFLELCQEIEQNVLEQAQEMVNQTDVNVLAQRGVRQLTSAELRKSDRSNEVSGSETGTQQY